MPPTGGIGLGTATGTVVINAQVTAAAQQIAAFSQQTQQQMAQVSASTNQTSASLTGLTNTLKQVAGAFGVNLGIQGAVQLGRAAVAAAELATAYNRQQVAAESLAGSQDELNALLAVYDQATGGILDKSTELANVTQLLSVGFADSAVELEQFATAIRGMSIATGRSADTITQNLILELFSQRGERLDQLGLIYADVRAKADELQAADSNLTKEQAYQNAVLVLANQRFGELAKSAEGGRTGLEHLAASAKDAQLAIGQLAKGPLSAGGDALSAWIQSQITMMNTYNTLLDNTIGKLFMLGKGIGTALGPSLEQLQNSPDFKDLMKVLQFATSTGAPASQAVPSWMTSVPRSASGPLGPAGPAVNPNQDEIDQAKFDRYSKELEITRQFNAAIDSENTSYQNRRLRSEESYQESVARSAADFAKGRMRAQEDYENSILDIMRQAQQRDLRLAEDHARDLARMQSDSAKRLGNLQEDLDRNNAQKRIDSADKVAEMVADHDKALADKRQDSLERLSDIERDYERQREQALRAHADTLSDAAARLDAFAVYNEQRRFNREQEEAAKAHDEKVSDEKTKLQKSLDNINESYNEKLADEQKALDKSIRQANDAHDRQVKDEQEALQTRIDDANDAYTRQLQDARDADTQRITDMAAHFDEQKRREDDDQRDRMGRMKDDHTAEMTQMDTEHGERITQIGDHAQGERDALDLAFQDQLLQLGEQNKAWKKAQDDFQKDALSSYQDMLDEQERAQINSQVRQLKNQLVSPDLSPDEIKAINDSITTLLTTLGNVGAGRSKPGTAPVMVPGGATIMPAQLGVSGSAAGTVASVAFAPGSIVIQGISGQTANELAAIIDQRIYQAVVRAAGQI